MPFIFILFPSLISFQDFSPPLLSFLLQLLATSFLSNLDYASRWWLEVNGMIPNKLFPLWGPSGSGLQWPVYHICFSCPLPHNKLFQTSIEGVSVMSQISFLKAKPKMTIFLFETMLIEKNAAGVWRRIDRGIKF